MKAPAKFPINFVLIDSENVLPKNLSFFQDAYFKIYMLIGAQQTKLDVGIVSVMQKIGPKRAKYVRVEAEPPELYFLNSDCGRCESSSNHG